MLGALTDGLRWLFLKLEGDKYLLSDSLTHKHDSLEILEILRDFMCGKDSPLLG